MPGRECYHCKQWVEEGEAHNCWTTTEAALTGDLPEDLKDAWERLRETAAELGDQRIYASLNSIMFSRKSCYFFVRPKRSYLEVCVFLGRSVKAPQIRRVEPSSKTKMVHFVQVRHRDEVEAPLTDWLREAYELQDMLPLQPLARGSTGGKKKSAGVKRTKSAGVKKKSAPGKKTAASARSRGSGKKTARRSAAPKTKRR